MPEAWERITIGGLEADVSAWCEICLRYLTPVGGTWRGEGFDAVVDHLRDEHGYDARKQ